MTLNSSYHPRINDHMWRMLRNASMYNYLIVCVSSIESFFSLLCRTRLSILWRIFSYRIYSVIVTIVVRDVGGTVMFLLTVNVYYVVVGEHSSAAWYSGVMPAVLPYSSKHRMLNVFDMDMRRNSQYIVNIY